MSWSSYSEETLNRSRPIADRHFNNPCPTPLWIGG